MTADRILFFLVRFNAAVLLLAAPCALLPVSWMETVHRDWLGLGSFPNTVISRYMARSLSMVYAMHGMIILVITFDWQRYRPLVAILAWLHIVFGCAMVAVDINAGVPWWWTIGEGPSLAMFGIVLLMLYRHLKQHHQPI